MAIKKSRKGGAVQRYGGEAGFMVAKWKKNINKHQNNFLVTRTRGKCQGGGRWGCGRGPAAGQGQSWQREHSPCLLLPVSVGCLEPGRGEPLGGGKAALPPGWGGSGHQEGHAGAGGGHLWQQVRRQL